PLYNWDAMRHAGYEWWRQRIRHARDLYDIVRIDHVVGLYRTYAIPVVNGGTAGFFPPDEEKQASHGRERLRASQARGGPRLRVVAEDLGSVPGWVREQLTALGIPGYKVFRWERRADEYLDPHTYPALSIATTGTHDTDTLVEWWEEMPSDERDAVLRLLGL